MAGSNEQQPPSYKPTAGKLDLISRGVKKPSPAGTLTFVGLRTLDIGLQYQLLAGGWGTALLAKLGASTIQAGPAFATGIRALDNLGLPLPHLVLLGMAAGSTAKQVYWLTRLSNEAFPADAATAVSFYNTLVNSTNSLLLLAAGTSVLASSTYDVAVGGSGASLPYQMVLATALYVGGLAVETLSEVQRKAFKDKPENQGKVMKEGLWAYARHINYGAYAVWRGAYCLASSGWIGGLVMAGFQSFDFATRSIPALNEYCGGRYGQQWEQFKKDVPYALIPGIY